MQYHRLPAAFGCRDWLSVKVTTVAELDDALDAVEAHDGAVLSACRHPSGDGILTGGDDGRVVWTRLEGEARGGGAHALGRTASRAIRPQARLWASLCWKRGG